MPRFLALLLEFELAHLVLILQELLFDDRVLLHRQLVVQIRRVRVAGADVPRHHFADGGPLLTEFIL